MIRIITTLLLAIAMFAVFTTTSFADQTHYSVQIGVFAQPEPARVAAASPVGAVAISISPRYGLTVFTVGNYNSYQQAVEAMNQLRDAGYIDAFVTKAGERTHSLEIKPR